MADRKLESGWMSVPAFGDWDMKNGAPDYSMDFSKIREKRKQNKSDFSRASLGNDEELAGAAAASTANAGSSLHNLKASSNHNNTNYTQLSLNSSETAASAHSPTTRKRIASYFVCCIGA